MSEGELILYTTEDGATIYTDGEAEETATCKPLLQVRMEGSREVSRQLKRYSLYDKSPEQAPAFSKKVENKMLWAVTGKTAAELIASRSDPDAPNMGLTSWRGSRVHRGDVGIGKNYLKAEEVDELNRIVVMCLDYAEDQAKGRRPVTMAESTEKLDAFLSFNERDVLQHASKLRMGVAQKLTVKRFEEFDANRRAAEALAANVDDIARLEAMEKATSSPKGRGG